MTNPLIRKSFIAKILVGIGCIGLPFLLLITASILFPPIQPFIVSENIVDGVFPSGEYRIKITNKANEPVQGAELRIFEGGTQIPAFNYPFDNYTSGKDVKSDELGQIIIIHKPRGFEWGGSCWSFFVFFGWCDVRPKYDVEISATGYKTITFSDEVFYNIRSRGKESGKTKVLLDNGQEEEIPILDLSYILENKE